ncbi:hypothetical protein D3C76_809760 [compost metagenome]
MSELRALGLVHRHGEHRFHVVETAGQYETHTTLAVIAREGHPQHLALRLQVVGHAQGNTDVPVHQAQAIVVTGHQHRAALVPEVFTFDQARAEQRPGNPLVQALDTPCPLAHGAKQLKGLECLQH